MLDSKIFRNSFDKENLANNNQRKTNKDNEFDDIILSLEETIKDINEGQNKFYIINKIENAILRLKEYHKKSNNEEMFQRNSIESEKIFLKPPSTGITTIELKKEQKEKYNYSPLRVQRNIKQTLSNSNQLSLTEKNKIIILIIYLIFLKNVKRYKFFTIYLIINIKL